VVVYFFAKIQILQPFCAFVTNPKMADDPPVLSQVFLLQFSEPKIVQGLVINTTTFPNDLIDNPENRQCTYGK
jgi:hypothetical protein